MLNCNVRYGWGTSLYGKRWAFNICNVKQRSSRKRATLHVARLIWGTHNVFNALTHSMHSSVDNAAKWVTVAKQGNARSTI